MTLRQSTARKLKKILLAALRQLRKFTRVNAIKKEIILRITAITIVIRMTILSIMKNGLTFNYKNKTV